METARNLFVQSIIESTYNAINKGDEARYKRYLNQLINILGADDPDITGLRIEKHYHIVNVAGDQRKSYKTSSSKSY